MTDTNDNTYLRERLGDIEAAEAKVKVAAIELATRKQHAAEGKQQYDAAIAELRQVASHPEDGLFNQKDCGNCAEGGCTVNPPEDCRCFGCNGMGHWEAMGGG